MKIFDHLSDIRMLSKDNQPIWKNRYNIAEESTSKKRKDKTKQNKQTNIK